MRALFVASLTLVACYGAPADPAPRPPRDDLAEGIVYLNDAAFRRATLEESLVNPGNTYSRQRLENYARANRGWDLLPVWNPRAVPVSREIAAAIAASGSIPELAADTRALFDGERPQTLADWRALGNQVFVRYPLRPDPILEWALSRPERAASAGLVRAADGSVPGLVLFRDLDGQSRIGITCALCHATVRDGQMVMGEARRAFDYGSLRAAFDQEVGSPEDDSVSRRLHAWGPGRVDVTEEDDDPVAIPDLWGLRDQSHLTQAGTIRHTGPAALAIREETQLLTANGQQARPPREVALALTLALYALTPPPSKAAPDAKEDMGEALFVEHCNGCHGNGAHSGAPIDAAVIDTDPALATGAARGTGRYRPAPLVRVKDAAPYFHDGSVATLEDVLDPARFEPTFDRGFLVSGPVRGHRFGTELSSEQRAALVRYLDTL